MQEALSLKYLKFKPKKIRCLTRFMNINVMFSNSSRSPLPAAGGNTLANPNVLTGRGTPLGGNPNVSRISGVVPKNATLGRGIAPQNSLFQQSQVSACDTVAFSVGVQLGEVIGTALAPDNTGAAIARTHQAVSEAETRVSLTDISVGDIFVRTHGSS